MKTVSLTSPMPFSERCRTAGLEMIAFAAGELRHWRKTDQRIPT